VRLFHLNLWRYTYILQNRIISLLDETWKPASNDAIDKYILYSPLATSNFYALITSDAPRDIRIELFAQVLEGIAFLHNNGMSHRDIKPANLAVITFDPPEARILDFGCATFSARTMYDAPGTIPYLAPEQEEGKYHDRSVDYWAIALVGLELIGFKNRGRVDTVQYPKIKAWLEDFERGQGPHPIAACCKSMLQWEPQDRMTAADALSRHLSAYRYQPQNKEQKRYANPIERDSKRGLGI
jgi:serine/threonine protein kinase